MTEQGFLVDLRQDGEDMADRVGADWIAQAGADGELGGFGESG